jgi:galactokinase
MDAAGIAIQFQQVFGEDPQVVGHAPGRVNIIGEHVDYNDGLVLPFAIAQGITVAARSDQSGSISAHSSALSADARFAVSVTEPCQPTNWENYLRGMVHGLRREGVELAGAKLWIGGDLPPASGLSSSAALCVSVGMALTRLAGGCLTRERLAKIAQAAEHQFAGTPCGLMDQMAACFGREDHALLLDCRDLSHQHVPCRPEGLDFVVIPSGVKHALADGTYARRVHACQAAVAAIAAAHPSIKSLRDVSIETLRSHRDRLGDEQFRRARHVVSELARVNDAVRMLKDGNWLRLGELLWQTQDSLRDDYEVSCVEIDELIGLLRERNDVLGARMVGGGFGGIVLAIVQSDRLDDVCDAINTRYYQPRGLAERPFTVTPSAGASVLEFA